LSPRTLGLVCAAIALALNVAIERALMGVANNFVIIPGLADFHHAWNRGVSFSLLTQSSDGGRYLLMAGLAAISVVVAVLVWRAPTRLGAAGYGLILGGALGNLVDRASFGAVFDFLYLHLGNTPLFVCNFADIAISAGVALLLLESFLVKPRSSAGPSQA
jgi:signal peptidase II